MKYKQGEKMIVEIAEVKENSYILNRIGEVEPMEEVSYPLLQAGDEREDT